MALEEPSGIEAAPPLPDPTVTPSPTEAAAPTLGVTTAPPLDAAAVPAPDSATVEPLIAAPPRRRRTGVLVAAVAAVLVLAAVTGTVVARSGGSPTRTPAAASGSVAASPSPSAPPETPVSADAYQAALTALDQHLAPLVSRLSAATTPKTVGDTLRNIEDTLSKDTETLRPMLPPAPVRTAQVHLLAALDRLVLDVGERATQTDARELCAAGLSSFSQTQGAGLLTAAAKELATADPTRAYHVARWVPAPIDPPDEMPDNGTVVKKPTKRGPGQLVLQNRRSGDVVVTLAPAGATTATLSVYVTSMQDYTYTGVPDGTYTIYFRDGGGWDPGAKVFTRSCTFNQFRDPQSFKTTSGQYTVLTVTLGMPGADSLTEDVDGDSIPR